MQVFLIVLAFLFLLTGLLGSVIPALPGPPLSYAGLLFLQWSGYGNFSLAFLLIWAAITAAVMVIDNFLPALMTKKFGGSRAAVFGSVLGLVAGMLFFAPLGLILGPFFGALAGELLNNYIHAKRKKIDSPGVDNTEGGGVNNNSYGNVRALKAATGALLAFILGTGAKLMIGSLMIYFAVKAVFFQN